MPVIFVFIDLDDDTFAIFEYLNSFECGVLLVFIFAVCFYNYFSYYLYVLMIAYLFTFLILSFHLFFSV